MLWSSKLSQYDRRDAELGKRRLQEQCKNTRLDPTGHHTSDPQRQTTVTAFF